MSELKHLLRMEWNDVEADWYYYLEVCTHPSRNHSCYSCYDDWWFMRRKCHNNQGSWAPVPNAYGDKEWAKKIAKHYDIQVPNSAESVKLRKITGK